MQKKRSEGEFGWMMRHRYHFFTHKWRDRGYPECPKCHRLITRCPYCRGDTLLPKAQTYPDFLLAFDWAFVEVKEVGSRFSWKTDITPNQYKVMETCREGWAFIEIGEGMAPKGRSAYFIPWTVLMKTIAELEENGIGSFVYEKSERGKSPAMKTMFPQYAMEWVDGGWAIQPEHPFWLTHKPNTEASYETK